MAKPGLDLTSCRGCLRTAAKGKGWALCLGAGASDPIFPRWGKLVETLLEWSDKRLSATEVSALLASISLESLIQSVFHRKRMSSARFASVLADLLYSNFKTNLSAKEWKLVERLFANISIPHLTSTNATDLLSSITNHYPGSTPLQLAEILGRSIASGCGPSVVITFNAEPLLLILAQSY